MKKSIFTISVLLFTNAYSQVIIGSKQQLTTQSVSLEFDDNVKKGLVLPWVSTVAQQPTETYKGMTLAELADGTMIYDVTDKKVKYKKDGNWFDLSVDVTGEVDLSLQNNLKENENAKVSIGTPTATPGIFVLEDTDKAMILPREASPHENIVNPQAGTIAYDTTKKLLAVFNGKKWTFWKGDDGSGNPAYTISNLGTGELLLGSSDATTLPPITLNVSSYDVATGKGGQGVIDNTTNKLSGAFTYQKGKGYFANFSQTQTTIPGEDGKTAVLLLKYNGGTFSTSGTGTIPFTIEVQGEGSYQVPKQNIGTTTEIARFKVSLNNIYQGDVIVNATGNTYTLKTIENAALTNTGYQSATMHYPENYNKTEKLPIVVAMHGWQGSKEKMSWVSKLAAENGFAAIAITETSLGDLAAGPPNWVERYKHAIDAAIAENNKTTSPLYQKLDINKITIVGHSMGGGGIFHYMDKNNSPANIKAIISLAPFIGTGGSAGTSVTKTPTLIISGGGDFIAPPRMGKEYFGKVPYTVKKYIEMPNVGHNDFESDGRERPYIPAISQHIIEWLNKYSK